MKEIWHRAFASVTRGADMHGVLVRSSALAICSTLFTLPYFHYLISVVSAQAHFPIVRTPWRLLFTELFLVFILCLLSAMVGFSFSERFELPGFGNRKYFFRSIPFILLIGLVMMVLSYFLFDRYFFKISPLSYPKDILYLISLPFKGAFTEEIILRLCLVTLSVGLLKSKGAGVVLVSALGSLFTIKYFYFFGIKFGLNYLFITQLLLSFSANLFLGYLFVTRGLLCSMALKFLFGIKYIVVSLAMG
jgi:hypothetical protein